MYEIICPHCRIEIVDIDSEELPERACDDAEMECPHCNHTFKFGWVAQLETR